MTFLIHILHMLITLYCSVVFLRFAAQWHGADFRNPLSQAVVQVTNPLLIPLRRFVPGWKGKDMAAIVLMALIVLVEILAVSALFSGSFHPVLLALTLVYQVITIAINTYFFALIISAIISWVNPDPYNPVSLFFKPITVPLLRPLQKHIKPIAGTLDLTPMILLLLIYIVKFYFAQGYAFILQSTVLLNAGDQALVVMMLK